MIPIFPEFKNLELSDKVEIEFITKQFPPHSEFHFVSIFCWDIDNSTFISKLNGNLILNQKDFLTGENIFSIIGKNSIPQTVNEIFIFLQLNNLPLILRLVPEETVKYLKGTKVAVSEDRDYFDYIYNVADLFYAAGNKYKKYRRNFSNFIKKYPDTYTRQIDLTCNDIKFQIIKLFKTWIENKEFKNKEFVHHFEYKALNKLLSATNEFTSLIALGVFNKDELIAFTIEDVFDCEYGCGLFWKADTNYIGLYQFLEKEITNLYHNRGIKFMSWESDLGIKSIRDSKLRYHPAFFLKKYKIEIVDSNFIG